jgi:hypothetical protein
MWSKRVWLLILAFLLALSLSACAEITAPTAQESQRTQETKESQEPQEAPLFEGENVTVTYLGVSEVVGVSGAFLLNLQMENTGDGSCVYYLQDVYVDDLHCQSMTGLPVTANPGKKVNGAFIISYGGDISEISTIEFQFVAANSDTYDQVETSDIITITP